MAALAATPLVACATAGTPPVKIDLAPARAAVEEARQAGAPARSADAFSRAEAHLKEAESLAATPARGGPAQRAADLAEVEAHWATSVARLTAPKELVSVASPEVERLLARLRKTEEEQHRLEDKVAMLSRDLEITETELIRSKARLQGNETKADASGAIAEARIVVSRLAQDKARSTLVARCQESLAKAEEQLVAGNYGAAIFFASKAQDTAAKSGTGETRTEADRPAPKPTYVAKTTVNIRRGPSTDDPVVGKAPAGATLEASATRGDWIKVTFNGVTGWAHASLLR
jgi:hypothetical protein